MEKQTQPKEKKQHMANPTDGATPRILKKKKKKKVKTQYTVCRFIK